MNEGKKKKSKMQSNFSSFVISIYCVHIVVLGLIYYVIFIYFSLKYYTTVSWYYVYKIEVIN